MPINRRRTHTLLSAILTLLALGQAVHADENIADAHDFRALQQEMQAKGLPLLLAFRADYCGFCKRLETEYLQPMVTSGKYDTRILIRRFTLDTEESVIDFNGDKIDATAFVARHDASLTPTIVFLDAEGKEVAERLLGYNSPDFYGAYLEDAIAIAQKAVQ